ncbi:hypothetical protein EV580_1302 [Mycobacterium sp. BK086]|uniref:phage fiber-tail adaptor protein n=1 Tax=Mycobacterium sp. BK086 TaxID=2512165 RepID=UPI00105FB68E|nr:hypothetical protein [Mycobacterium sp. BK086]TDO18120.1 hypothetical protein EV580_1302 [Mycobacterium sp. BK086]
MPVLEDTARTVGAVITGATTTKTLTVDLNVSTALEDSCLIVGVALVGGTNISTAGMAATFNGDALSAISGASVAWASNHRLMKAFALQDVDLGKHTLSVVVSSIPTEVSPRAILVSAASYGGVESVGSAVTVNTGSTATANAVEVDSVNAAHRVVGLHCTAGVAAGFTGAYSGGVQRANAIQVLYGHLMLGDGPGDDDVTLSAAQYIFPGAGGNDDWAAMGFDLTPATVHLSAAATMSEFDSVANMSVYKPRQADRSARYWIIPGLEAPPASVWPAKDPSSAAICPFDWSNDLAEDETVTEVDFGSTSERLTVEDFGIEEQTAWALISGGDPGGTYPVGCTITTSAGQTLNATEYLIMEDRRL